MKEIKKIDISGNAGYLKRHIPFVLNNITPARMINGVRAMSSYISKRTYNKGYPSVLKIETSALCNLTCPGCTHGAENQHFKRHMMIDYGLFKKVIDEVGPHLHKVIMHHRGEAFLNKDIYRMLRYLKRYNIASVVSSNFSFRFREADFRHAEFVL